MVIILQEQSSWVFLWRLTNCKRREAFRRNSYFGVQGYVSVNFLSDFQSFVFLTPSSNLIKRYSNCSSDLKEFLNSYQKLFMVATCVMEHV